MNMLDTCAVKLKNMYKILQQSRFFWKFKSFMRNPGTKELLKRSVWERGKLYNFWRLKLSLDCPFLDNIP